MVQCTGRKGLARRLQVLGLKPVLWLFGGAAWWFNPHIVRKAAAAFPPLAAAGGRWLGLPFMPWKGLYQMYIAPVGSPSTGWIGASVPPAYPTQPTHSATQHCSL